MTRELGYYPHMLGWICDGACQKVSSKDTLGGYNVFNDPNDLTLSSASAVTRDPLTPQ